MILSLFQFRLQWTEWKERDYIFSIISLPLLKNVALTASNKDLICPSPDTWAALHEQTTIIKSQPVINCNDPDLNSECGDLEILLAVITRRASHRKSGRDSSWGKY